MTDDPVLRNILTALNRSRVSTARLADVTQIPLGELERILHGEAPLTVPDATRIATALRMTAAALFAIPLALPVPVPERLAYSLPAFADAVCLSIDTIRKAIGRGELVARYPTPAGRKPIITRKEGLAWLEDLSADVTTPRDWRR